MQGTPFHGEYVGIAPVSAEQDMRFRLYPNAGRDQKGEMTLGPCEQVFITDIHVHNGDTAQTIVLFDGPDNVPDEGEIIDQAEYGENGGMNGPIYQHHACRVGTYPKVQHSEPCTATIRGYLLS